uniref:WD_REPEATS_REGION domain-containing protein n=1 Tax=Trichuris muris TaxID=70415 RepID=A0A5S6QLK2_TRIMR
MWNRKYLLPETCLRSVHEYQWLRTSGCLPSSAAKDVVQSLDAFARRMKITARLAVHRLCVNTVCWSEDGRRILSGSDDRMLAVTDPFCGPNERDVKFRSHHEGIIFCARFLPKTNSTQAISCGANGLVILHDLNYLEMPVNVYQLCEPSCAVKRVAVFQDNPSTFLACCHDRVIRLMDIRLKLANSDKVGEVLMHGFEFAHTLDVSAKRPYLLAVGALGPMVSLVDLRKVSGNANAKDAVCSIMGYNPKSERTVGQVTCVQFAPFGDELLASFSSGKLYLLDSIRFSGESGYCLPTEGSQATRVHLRMAGDWSDTGPTSRPSIYSHAVNVNDQAIQINYLNGVLNRLLRDTSPRMIPRLLEQLRLTFATHRSSNDASAAVSASRQAQIDNSEEMDFSSMYNASQNLPQPLVVNAFAGHRNCRTRCKEANFWGRRYVISGSDCGRIFIWDKSTGSIVAVHEGDQHVVNCVQPHPYMPILATSGIDHNVKIWAPVGKDIPLEDMNIEDIVSNNATMTSLAELTLSFPTSL